MKKSLFLTLLALSVLANKLLLAQEESLKTNDVSKIMGQILSQHVDQRSISSKILQTALIKYIDQFDPHRLYLLEGEVQPFMHLSEAQLNVLAEQYKQGNFALFQELNGIIQKSIERARQVRQIVEQKPHLAKDAVGQELPLIIMSRPDQETFASQPDQLQERWLHQILIFIKTQEKRYGENSVRQKQSQLMANYEAQIRDIENQYLYQNPDGHPLQSNEQETLFTIHILKALASSLDAHTSFYQPHEAYDLRVRLKKAFPGIGIMFKEAAGGVTVSRLLEGGPAAKSGQIQEGDVLIQVDGKSVEGEPLDKVIDLLHGDPNPTVNLGFKRQAEGRPSQTIEVKLTKQRIVLNNDRVDTDYETYGNGIIGKLTLHSFYQGDGITSEKDVRDAIHKLEKQGNLRGLILDLRDNTGGFLSQAVKVAGLFITNGIIVISKYSDGDERFYRDVDGKTIYDGPLVVLTSKMTASAAEIVAQALQDYGVAVIVGDEHTYGKGTIQTQTVTDNQSSSFFKVTVGKYYTVSGKTPQKQGVKADIVVPSILSRLPIGEEYVESVEGDNIPPAFEDQLEDVAPDIKAWYLKYYMPTLQHRKLVWGDLLPTLRKNSGYRLEHNKNYQLYLKGENPEDKDKDKDEEEEWMQNNKKNQNFGENDLQMQEAVNIVKDMIMLHSFQSAHH